MRLVKIQDLSARPITSIELVSNYLFGDSIPKQFSPGTNYLAGEYVYHVNPNGAINIYYCLTSGTYITLDNNNWMIASVPDIVRKLIEEYVLNGITDTDVIEIPAVDFTYATYTSNDELVCNDDIVKLPFTYDRHRHHIEVYVNGLRKSPIDGEYVFISPNNIQLSKAVTANDVVSIDVLSKNDTASRLIYTLEYHPAAIQTISDNSTVLKVEIPSYLPEKSLVFDIFNRGMYVSEVYYTYYYDQSTSSYIIKISGEQNISNNLEDVCVVFTCSISKDIVIKKTDVKHVVVSDPARFQLDMMYTDFKDISNVYNVYGEGVLIPNTSTVLYNSTVNITDDGYYLNPSETLVVTYKNIIQSAIFTNSDEPSNIYHEVVHITETHEETKQVPIPFIEFDPNVNTLMVFKNSGYLVSSTRYYIKDNILTFFPHDNSLVEGDTLTFQVLNNDGSVCGYTKNVTLTQDHLDNGLKLDQRGFDIHAFDPIVFTTTGLYVPVTDYIIEDGRIKFTTTSGLSVGDTLEIVLFEYIKPVSSTMMRLYNGKVSSPTELILPFAYNKELDNIIILRSSGMYVDKSRYTISTTGLVEIKSGTTFNSNEFVDVVLFRNYNRPMSTLGIMQIR